MSDVKTRVIIDANASNAIKEIDKLDEAAQDADKTIKKLDDQTVEVEVNADGMDRLRQKGEEAIAEVKALSDQKVVIDVDADKLDKLAPAADGARGKIDEVGKSADSSKSVLANMVGNATQDLGALGGVAGSAGVAIGQMGEYMADAAASGEGMGSIIKNFAGVGAPIAAISIAMAGVAKVMSSIAESKAFDKKQVEAFSDAVKEVGEGARAVLATIKETQAVSGRAGGLFGTKAMEETKDITKQLVEAGVSADLFAQAVANGGPAMDEAVAKLEALRVSAKAAYEVAPTSENTAKLTDYTAAIEVLRETHANYAAQQASDDTFSKFMADSEAGQAATEAWNNTLNTGINILNGTGNAMGGASDKTKDLAADYRDAKQAANDLTYANQLLRGDIGQDQAYLHLQQQFDETKRRGVEAMQAVHDKAKDADSKMRDYQTSVNDSKLAVMDFNDEWSNVTLDQTLTMNTEIERGQLDQVIVDVGKATSTTHWIDVRVRTTIDQAWERVMGSRI